MGMSVYALSPIAVESFAKLFLLVGGAGILYGILMWVLTGWRLKQEFRIIREALRKP